MDKFVVTGATPLNGIWEVAGAKNVALKMPVIALLTDSEVILHNIPLISDVFFMLEVLSSLGVKSQIKGHTLYIKNGHVSEITVPLEVGARLRSSSLVLGPMLARWGHAKIPNPGGCRIGARPIDRHVEALTAMGATINYNSADGYFHAQAKKLRGTTIVFPKNTHTGTETIILAAVLAEGTTVIENAAQEAEIDDLTACLNLMGAKIRRVASRQIVIEGVKRLSGVEYTIMPDRNEEVTVAVAAAASGGTVTVKNSQPQFLTAFLSAFRQAGGKIELLEKGVTRYSREGKLSATDIVTQPYPGFMTDWQAPWAVLMSQAYGRSTIHETVFESRFSYVKELVKMGAEIEFFDPQVPNPDKFYNFNWSDLTHGNHQAIRIKGPVKLHNAVVTIDDLRAGATLLIAALIARGASYIHGVEQIDRGYEKIEERLVKLGAKIKRLTSDHL
ncbi:MAG: UDP-N-acetylglucosamine 1-carboxyvinyltransferase [Patescibacteria group bacterium]